MAGIPGIPQNFAVQTANQQILVSWNLSAGATSYDIQRSEDNVTFTALITMSGTPLATSYLDTAVTLGVTYWYNVRATNTSGSSSYTLSQSAIPTPTGEMTLSQIRLEAKQRADRVNSNFVTDPEWRTNINKAMFELYDLLVDAYEDYFLAEPIAVIADGTTSAFTLPNGSNTFLSGQNLGQTVTPPPFYKFMGMDLALNTAQNAFVTVNKFNFSDRNRFVYPNTASTIYGVFNLQYRVMGGKIRFIPTPSAGQALQFWYIPRLKELLQETDTTDIGISGWLEYVIVRSAKYALDKEESDSSKLDTEILFLKGRIEEAASNRDAGMPDTISDVNNGNWSNGWSGGRNGSIGGFALAPFLMTNNEANHSLTNTILSGQSLLGNITLGISLAYFAYLYRRELGCGILFSRIGNFISNSTSAFVSHVLKIISLSPKPQMCGIHTQWIITAMTNILTFIKRSIFNFISNPSRDKINRLDGKSWSAVSTDASYPGPTIGMAASNDAAIKPIDNTLLYHANTITYNYRGVK